ncbi:MAG: hypothetical protein JO288_20455 [Hyphomicrobiales bacterium]|nr:hypothetical protein [Hyphomicrobiales bacterium]
MGFGWRARIFLGLTIAAASAGSALAMGGAGPPLSSMTANYCRERVYNRGITGADRFEAEVRKCIANPVTYPTAPGSAR